MRTVLDDHWISALDKVKKGGKRFSMEWYLKHPITIELLNSCVLEDNVLDIGCGTGQRAFIVHEQEECNIVGIDGSAYAIDYANDKFGSTTLRFVNDNVTAMPFKNNSFDNAYMLAVIEHVSNTELLLSEIERVLAPGGTLFLCVTENDYHSSPDHVHVFSKTSLHETFKDYKIIDSFVKGNIIFMTVKMSDDLKFRGLAKKDLEKVRLWRMSPEVTRYLLTDPVITEESQKQWYQDMSKRGDIYWIVNFKGVDIGYASLNGIDTQSLSADPGVYIGEVEYCGIGLGGKILKRIEEYAFKHLSLHKLYGYIISENNRAIKMYSKNGWVCEAVLPNHVMKHKLYDVQIMSLVRNP